MITKPFTLGLVGKVVLNVVGIVGLATLAGCDSQGNLYPSTQMNIGSAVAQDAALNPNLQPEQVQSLGIVGGLLGVLASQQAQREAAEIGRTNVNVNVNNSNQPTFSDSSIRYVTDQKMTNEGTYTGSLKLRSDGFLHPHGHGVYTWPSGNRYEGEFVNGDRNGHGVATWANGERYEGEWKDNNENGYGVYTFPSGEKYDGLWKDGKFFAYKSHQPTVSDSSIRYETDLKGNDGSSYTGSMKLMSDGLYYPHGKGKFVYANGGKYEGEFVNGTRNGQAVMTWPDGKRHEGEWKDDRPNGKGKFVYDNGERYEGEFKDGQPNGKGVYTFLGGKRHEGEWKDGLPNGQGVMTLPSGERYEGKFKDGQPNGKGVHTWPIGERYEGEFKNGKCNGQGVFTFPSGERYEGEFKDDKRNGHGVQAFPSGERYEGEFKDDKRNGQGVMTWPDGKRYEGEWKDEKMHGFGKMVYADGRIEEGEWRDDKFVGTQSQVSTGDNQRGQGGSSKFGFVNVTADDPTFEVFVDGDFVGNSPAKLKLSEGPHTIEVRKEGFKDYKKEIRVTDGSELNLRAVLEKQ